MSYGFSKSIRERYRKLWARKQSGKGTVKAENLKNQRESTIITKKRKRKSKKSLKRQKIG